MNWDWSGLDLFGNYGFNPGRLISASKSGYRERFPENEVYFNANIIIEPQGKVWFGDLDLTRSKGDLQEIATELGTTLYVLREMDGRFGNENKPASELKHLAICVIEPK